MSYMSDLYIELENYVYDALEQGAACETDVIDYLNVHHSNFPLRFDEDLIAQMIDNSTFYGDHRSYFSF